MNWKGGGKLERDHWTYSLKPLHDRPAPPDKPSAWCEIRDSDKSTCKVTLSGTGWQSSNHGQELRERLDWTWDGIKKNKFKLYKVGLNTTMWGESFKYELEGGREWSVTVTSDFFCSTPSFSDFIFEGSMKYVANPKDKNYLDVKCEHN